MEEKKGKIYVNRREDCPEGDFYPTPRSLTRLLLGMGIPEVETCLKEKSPILEPAAGMGAIAEEVSRVGGRVRTHDLYYGDKVDFLTLDEAEPYELLITNPPFSHFDEFVEKAREVSKTFIFIGKVNFFGSQGRYRSGIWKGLRDVFVFNRMVDYRSPDNPEGNFCVGNLVTAWMVWDRKWKKDYARQSVVDVSPWAVLGQYKE